METYIQDCEDILNFLRLQILIDRSFGSFKLALLQPLQNIKKCLRINDKATFLRNRAFYFVKWSGKQIFNRYWSVTKQRLPICTKTSKVVYDKIQSVGHTVQRAYSLQTKQTLGHTACMPDSHTICRSFSPQTIHSVDHSRPYYLQTIQSADYLVCQQLLQATGLEISFPASPEKDALLVEMNIAIQLSASIGYLSLFWK